MDQDKVGLAQSRVIQNALEQYRVGAGQHEVGSATAASVEMNGQAKASCLGRDVTEEIVLEFDVLARLRRAACGVARIDGPGLSQCGGRIHRRRSKIEAPQVSRFKLDGHCAILLLRLQYG